MKAIKKKSPPTLAELYPELTSEELTETKYTLGRYIDLVWRIYQRIRSEKSKFDEKPFKR
jgi:hypothetical protein